MIFFKIKTLFSFLNLVLDSPIITSINSHKKSIRLSNIDSTTSLSRKPKRFNRLLSRKNDQDIYIRNNTNSGGGDSGYSEESFATTRISSLKRPLHTSCPHCHCEQRSSFNNYKKSIENSSTDSSTSDTTINTSQLYYKYYQNKQYLSSSRSYPHIKPLPKTNNEQEKKSKTISARRRRHLSCDSSLWTKTQQTIPITSQTNYIPLQRHFTTIGMIHYNPSSTFSPLPKTNQVFGELNLAAIELDSLHRTSLSTTSSSSSLSSSPIIHSNKKKHRKNLYLVWHEYKNSSLLSTTNGTKIFSVVRGDQVRLLKRIGKSTLLVQKEDDGSIGFLPQSCLAHDQINSFLSVKGLRETVL